MLHVSLLGEQVISDAAGVVRMRSSRTIALLGLLAWHAGRPQPRQRIAALFWPDSSEAQALTNLRRELHYLRNALAGDAALEVTARELCWRDSATCEVDLRVFERERSQALAAVAAGLEPAEVLAHATVAVERYRGEFLPGGYDDWLLAARAELEGSCVELLDVVGEVRTRSGDLAGAVDAARRRVQLRPLEEVGYRTLMHLQGELGERAAAVSTYHHCASVLERELGVEPDPATRALLNRLLAPAEAPAVPVPPVPPVPVRPVPSAVGRSGVAGVRLVGRAREFNLLNALWDGASAGRPSIALVRGDPGLGKTRLVAEVADVARARGAVVAGAQCFGPSGRLALAPVADWLRTPAVQSAVTALEPVWRVEVERLVPPATGRAQPVVATRTMVDAWQRHRFFEGLARAFIGVGRPLLLVLDNLQWCDQETLAFVTFCLGLTTDTPIMVAATVRNTDDRDLLDWTDRLRATGLVTEVALCPLDVAETAQLAAALSGQALGEDDAQLLHATTGGFPLYVVEAARASAGPDRDRLPVGDLTAVLRNRFEQISADACEIAGLAAAMGRTFSLELLTEASDLDADRVVAAIDELWRYRIVRETGDAYDFSHDLLRDCAYALVSPPKRWLLHRRLAQALELLHASDLDAVAAQLAEQYARGGRSERALVYYRRAADDAAAMFAHAEAVRLDREALSILRGQATTRDRSRQELEVLEAMTAPLNARYGYSSPQVRDTLDRSIALAEMLGRRGSIVTGMVGRWTSQFVQGKMSAAYQTAAKTLTLVEPGSAMAGAAHFAMGGSAIHLGRPAEAIEHLELAAVLGGTEALTVGTRAAVHSRAFAAHAHWLLGHDAQSLANCTEAIALARADDNPYSLAVALAYAAITHQMREDPVALGETVTELRELCDRYEFAYYREWALILDGWSRPGTSGIGLTKRGIDNLAAEGAFARMPYWLALLADLSMRDGEPDAARAILDGALVRGQAGDDVWWLPEVMRRRAALDEPAAAIARVRSAAELAAAHGSVTLLARCAADLAARGVRD